MNDATLMKMYELCTLDDDCERGENHVGSCGPCECSTKHQGSCVAAGELARRPTPTLTSPEHRGGTP